MVAGNWKWNQSGEGEEVEVSKWEVCVEEGTEGKQMVDVNVVEVEEVE